MWVTLQVLRRNDPADLPAQSRQHVHDAGRRRPPLAGPDLSDIHLTQRAWQLISGAVG